MDHQSTSSFFSKDDSLPPDAAPPGSASWLCRALLPGSDEMNAPHADFSVDLSQPPGSKEVVTLPRMTLYLLAQLRLSVCLHFLLRTWFAHRLHRGHCSPTWLHSGCCFIKDFTSPPGSIEDFDPSPDSIYNVTPPPGYFKDIASPPGSIEGIVTLPGSTQEVSPSPSFIKNIVPPPGSTQDIALYPLAPPRTWLHILALLWHHTITWLHLLKCCFIAWLHQIHQPSPRLC